MENLILKSGFGEVDSSQSELDLKLNVTSLLTVFMENAIKTAGIYTKHSQRKIITSKDISYALKRQLFKFLDTENLVERAKEISKDFKKELDEKEYDEEEYDEDDEEEYDEEEYDEEEYDEEQELVEPTDDEKKNEEKEVFKESTCTCNICTETNYYVNIWNTWSPSSDIEKILYDGIQKIDLQFNIN